MNQFYAINIQNDYATILFLKRNHDVFSIIEHQIIDISELSDFLKNKNSFYLSVEQSDVVDEKINIPAAITNDSVVRNFILKKFKDTISNEKNLFNYCQLAKNEQDNTITYQIDGVNTAEYTEKLLLTGDLNKIKSSSTTKFALFSLSEKCIKQESYLSIYTQAKNIIILAIHKNVLIFSRTSSVKIEAIEMQHINMIDEINQTISYIQQQYRDIKFSAIALSGSLAIDDVVPEHLHMSTNLPVSVLYPNTFVKGLDNEELQHYIIPVGSLFIPKKFQFLPASILNFRQYSLISNILITISILSIFVISFFTYEKYISYSDALNRYETSKSELMDIMKKTDAREEKTLKRDLQHIYKTEKYLQHYPSDAILALKPLIQLQKPKDIEWENGDGNIEMKVVFEKSFNKLAKLSKFEKEFKKRFNDINSSYKFIYTTNTDYQKMIFNTTLKTDKAQDKTRKQARRRR